MVPNVFVCMYERRHECAWTQGAPSYAYMPLWVRLYMYTATRGALVYVMLNV